MQPFDRPRMVLRDCAAELPDDAWRARGEARDFLTEEAVREEMRFEHDADRGEEPGDDRDDEAGDYLMRAPLARTRGAEASLPNEAARIVAKHLDDPDGGQQAVRQARKRDTADSDQVEDARARGLERVHREGNGYLRDEDAETDVQNDASPCGRREVREADFHPEGNRSGTDREQRQGQQGVHADSPRRKTTTERLSTIGGRS